MKRLKHFALFLAFAIFVPASEAQTIPNPSFEADHFVNGVGYAAQNGGVITGWMLSNTNRIGLNVGGTNNSVLFADNGVIPNGSNVAFIQATSSTNTLATTITGLTPGTVYRVSFRANHRAVYEAGIQTWSLNGGAFLPFTALPAVGNFHPYYTNSASFIATSNTAPLVLQNGTATGDATVLVDDFSIVVLPPQVTTLNDYGAGSLRQAVSNAVDGDIITFAPELSGATITLTNDNLFVTKNLTIDASALLDGLTLSANYKYRHFQVDSHNRLTLSHLTFIQGQAIGGDGGSGYVGSGCTLHVIACSFIGNASSAGGHGGVLTSIQGTINIENSTLSGNSGGYGGGIYSDGGTVTLTNTTVSGNFAKFSGGGILSSSSVLILNHTTVSANSCPTGPAVADYGPCTLNNSIVAGNTNNISGNIFPPLDATNSINSIISGDPKLAPLGNYGGPTQTMPPLPGSLAIDAGATTSLTTDQRGSARVIGAAPDVGAVESGGLWVQNNNDSGTNSLREILANVTSATNPTTILFTTNLSGATITLTNDNLFVTKNVTIDASALPGGLTLSANYKYRHFQINSHNRLTLSHLTFIQGRAIGGDGGSGYVGSGCTLHVIACSFIGNACSDQSFGGALDSEGGTINIENSTLSGNSSGYGGGIYSVGGTVTLNNTTVSGNFAFNSGGGIRSDSSFLTLNYTTVSANSTAARGVGGGGSVLLTYGSDTITLNNSIIAGNTGINGSDDNTVFYIATVNNINSIISGDPKLAPLGNYGGPTQTMPPLPDSPAIDAGSPISPSTDQRGLARVIGAAPDIGAVESGGLWVQNNHNSGANSLRDVLASAASAPGPTIIFFTPNLSGATIGLTSEILLTNGVAIDATSLPGGVTLSGGNASRILSVSSNATVSLTGLTLAGGNATTSGEFNYGGAINNLGSLSLLRCALVGNIADGSGGGAIANQAGTVSLTQCALTGNSARYGGAIYTDDGTLTFNDCTLAGNTARFGGALLNNGSAMTLNHCTVTLNQSTGDSAGFEGGGGIHQYSGDQTAITILTGSILAGNSALLETGPDFWAQSGTVVADHCLLGKGNDSTIVNGGNNNIVGDSGSPIAAKLAALGNYGGPTQTMPPLPGSLAIDAAGSTGSAADQRGYPRFLGLAADIGAVEGVYNPAGPGKITGLGRLIDGSARLSFTNSTDATFSVLATTGTGLSATNWTQIGFATESPAGSGLYFFTDAQATNFPQRFYRVQTH